MIWDINKTPKNDTTPKKVLRQKNIFVIIKNSLDNIIMKGLAQLFWSPENNFLKWYVAETNDDGKGAYF